MGFLRKAIEFVVRPTHSRTIGILLVLTLVGGIFLTVSVAQQQQNLRQQAAEKDKSTQILSRVEIQPASLTTTVGTSSAIGMSALAYDVNDQPIWEGVSYNWGISSLNSVGTLNPTSGSITTFIPLNQGSGDLWVHATLLENTVVKSMLVKVGTKLSKPSDSSTKIKFNDSINKIFTDKNEFLISNKDQEVTIYFYKTAEDPSLDPTGEKADYKKTVNLTYNNGTFSAPSIDFEDLNVGTYKILIKSPKYLRKLVTTEQISLNGGNITFPSGITLADGIGDINDDNILDINDYNAILGCYGGKIDTCKSQDLADLNDDNNIDGIDYNLFLKSLSRPSRQGD